MLMTLCHSECLVAAVLSVEYSESWKTQIFGRLFLYKCACLILLTFFCAAFTKQMTNFLFLTFSKPKPKTVFFVKNDILDQKRYMLTTL